MDIQEEKVFLYPHEEQITGYTSPVPIADIDLKAMKARIEELELDFFDPEKSEIGNSFVRYRELQQEKQLVAGIIDQIEYYRRHGHPPQDFDT